MLISSSDGEMEFRRPGTANQIQYLIGGTNGAAPSSTLPINNLQRIFSFYRLPATLSTTYINNNVEGTIYPDSTNRGNSTLYLGSRGGNSYLFDGNVQEMVIYTTDQSANHSNINGNINTFYSIY
jgi:hypothetical protein